MKKVEYKVQHIVLADDDRDHSVLFKKILAKEFPGVGIHIVNDSAQLLPYLHLHPVDLLFLDLNMPCKNGYECLLELKKDPALLDLPIIVYSSSAHLQDIQRSFFAPCRFLPGKTIQYRTSKKSLKDDPFF